VLNIEKGVVGTWFQVFAKPSVRVIPENSKEAPVRNEAARLLLEESVETLHSSASGLISAEGLAFFIHRKLRPMNEKALRAGSHCVGVELYR